MGGILKEYVKGFSLDSILTLIEMIQATWTLKIMSDGRVGHLYFEGGKIIDAEVQDLRGEGAALELVSWENIEIHIIKFCTRSPVIHRPMMGLLLEGKRLKDEGREDRRLRTRRLEEAVAHVEGVRFKQGRDILDRLLAQDARDHRAWLWYSRTAGTMKAILSAIDRAQLMAPEAPEIAREKAVVERAEKWVTDERVKRCPFCWAPLNLSALDCGNCHLHLRISRSSLGAGRGNGDPDLIHGAVKRFSRVLGRETNLYATYYLAMAHYNLDDMDRTLELLNEAASLAANRKFFSDQLAVCLHYMAGGEFHFEENGGVSRAVEPPDRGKKVLVVEDSASTRKVITITLTRGGYRTVEAADGLEALSKLGEEEPDLVLLDIGLPKMDGYEVLANIKTNRKFSQLPVVVLTGRHGFVSRMKMKMAGSAACLTKPFNPDGLLDAVGEALSL